MNTVDIYKFFNDMFNMDMSDSAYYWNDELVDRVGTYDYVDDVIYINPSLNSIARELTLVHELTHRLCYMLSLYTVDEEAYCKQVTTDYVEQVFGIQGLTLLGDWL